MSNRHSDARPATAGAGAPGTGVLGSFAEHAELLALNATFPWSRTEHRAPWLLAVAAAAETPLRDDALA